MEFKRRWGMAARATKGLLAAYSFDYSVGRPLWGIGSRTGGGKGRCSAYRLIATLVKDIYRT
jgi:hypothetical protein